MSNSDEWTKVEPEKGGDAWDYRKQKEIVGILTEVRENVGPNNSKMYMLSEPDGTVTGVWGSAVLDLRLKNIQAGQEVKIVYLGKAKSEKTGRFYHAFDVFTK